MSSGGPMRVEKIYSEWVLRQPSGDTVLQTVKKDSPRKSLLAGLKQLGFSLIDSDVYICICSHHRATLQRILQETRHDAESIEESIERLAALFLVRADKQGGKIRYYATPSHMVWQSFEYAVAWQSASKIMTRPEHELPDAMAEQRRRSLFEMRLASTLASAGNDGFQFVRENLRFSTIDEFAIAYCEAISSARTSIVAIEKSPRLPHVELVWSSLIERLASGVSYTRVVPIDEILAHGFGIVLRDVVELGIDLRLVPSAEIPSTLFLIDQRVLFRRDEGKAEAAGFMTRNSPLVRRYRRQRVDPMVEGAIKFTSIMPEIESFLGRRSTQLQSGYDDPRYASTFSRIAEMGQFANLGPDERKAAARLVDDGFLQTLSQGFSVRLSPEEVRLWSLL